MAEENFVELEKQDRMPLAYHPDEKLTQEIIGAFQWEYASSGYENLPVKSSATQLLPKADFATGTTADVGFGKVDIAETEGTLFDETEETIQPSDKDVGIAYHGFLEKFDFALLYDENGAPVGKATLEGIVADSFAEFEADSEVDLGLLSKAKLVEILSNPVFYTLQGTRLYKEQQFLAALPVKDTYAKREDVPLTLQERTDGEEMLFQGAIDLLSVGEEVRIIDYKYSSRNAETLRSHYRPQLELYRLATAKILKIDPKRIRCSIVNIKRGFQVDMD